MSHRGPRSPPQGGAGTPSMRADSAEGLGKSERRAAGRLRILDATGCARLDDVPAEQPGVDRAAVDDGVGLIALGERLACRVNVLDTVSIVPIDRPLFDGHQEEAWVVIPSAISTGADNDLLGVDVRRTAG